MNGIEKEPELVIDNMIIDNEEDMVRLKAREKFLSRKAVTASSGKTMYELELGQIQRELKDKQEWIDFLKKYKL